MEMLRPRGWSLVALAAAVALMVGAFLASDYVSGLLASQAQMRARISALESRTPGTVTVSPSPSSPSPTESASPPSGDTPEPDSPPVAAASGAREPVSRSPRDPGTGGSSPRPPVAAPPARPETPKEPDDCSGGTLINLCLDVGLLSTESND